MATMAYGLGVGAVPYTMLGELFTPKVVQPTKSKYYKQKLSKHYQTKIAHQILPNELSSASCIWILYSPGYSIFMLMQFLLLVRLLYRYVEKTFYKKNMHFLQVVRSVTVFGLLKLIPIMVKIELDMSDTLPTLKLMVVELCEAFSSKCSENYFPYRCLS